MAAPIPFPMIVEIILVVGVGVILAVPFPMIVGLILVVGVGVIRCTGSWNDAFDAGNEAITCTSQ